ncbi:uncharacterized protein [Haliotis asinina]|uniref:uncharacterized protein n=1 Tax=Haliotis asinina TaxID=109174 RepID=UPI0035320684
MGCTSSAKVVSPIPEGKENQPVKHQAKPQHGKQLAQSDLPSGSKSSTPRSRMGTRERVENHLKVETEEVTSETLAGLREVPPSYPPPEPPSVSKELYLRGVNFTKTDQLASRVPDDALSSYDGLFKYLTLESKEELFKVRAILVWLVRAYVQPLLTTTGQGQTEGQGYDDTQGHNLTEISDQDKIEDGASIESDDDGNVEENINMNGLYKRRVQQKPPINHTPRLDLDLLHKGQVGLSTMFAFCCRKAGLKCAVIRGHCKPDGYEVDGEMCSRGDWTSVNLNGAWRLIHPLWSITHTTAEASRVKDEIVIEDSKLEHEFDDYYFLTNPDELITSCVPDNPKWQLLKKPVPSGRFQLMPYFTRHFFKLGLSMSRDKDGILKTTHGKSRVDIDFPMGNQPQLYYHIAEKTVPPADDTEPSVVMDTDSLRKCVFMFKIESTYSFRLCFKKGGVYIFRIYGGHVKHVDREVHRASLLCQLQVHCEEPDPSWQPTPLSPAIGWGQSELGVKMGVIPISHKGGIAYTNEHRKANFMFKVAPSSELQANLISSKTNNPLSALDFVYKDNKAVLSVVLPSDEGLCLRVNARAKNESGKDFVNVCNFIVKVQPVPLKKERARDRRLKNMLEAAIIAGTENQLVKAMNEYTMFVHTDTGELDRAEDRLACLRLKNNLFDAIQREFVPYLEMVIYDAETSNHAEELKSYIRVAKAHLQHLQRTATYKNHVLSLNQSLLLEIRGYMEPSSVIYDVMVAVLILLGERRSNLFEWKYVRGTLSRTGRTSILNRMENFQSERVSHDRLMEADAILSQHSLDEVWEASAGAAVMHKWARDAVEKIKYGESTNSGADSNNVDNADVENLPTSLETDSNGSPEDVVEADKIESQTLPGNVMPDRSDKGHRKRNASGSINDSGEDAGGGGGDDDDEEEEEEDVTARQISPEFVENATSTGNKVGGESESQGHGHSEDVSQAANDGDDNLSLQDQTKSGSRSSSRDKGPKLYPADDGDIAAAREISTESVDFARASPTDNSVDDENESQSQGQGRAEGDAEGTNDRDGMDVPKK